MGEAQAMPKSWISMATDIIERSVRETVGQQMAECSALYFPKPLPRLPLDELRQPFNVIPHPSRRQTLRDFLDDQHADFKVPEQAVIVEKMQASDKHLLAICGAGVGKTFLVLMQAKMYDPGMVTIVVLPLSGLIPDFKRRARERHVSLSQWNPKGSFNEDAHVILVSVEHMAFEAFIP